VLREIRVPQSKICEPDRGSKPPSDSDTGLHGGDQEFLEPGACMVTRISADRPPSRSSGEQNTGKSERFAGGGRFAKSGPPFRGRKKMSTTRARGVGDADNGSGKRSRSQLTCSPAGSAQREELVTKARIEPLSRISGKRARNCKSALICGGGVQKIRSGRCSCDLTFQPTFLIVCRVVAGFEEQQTESMPDSDRSAGIARRLGPLHQH